MHHARMDAFSNVAGERPGHCGPASFAAFIETYWIVARHRDVRLIGPFAVDGASIEEPRAAKNEIL
jgi:hypothetical protein